MFVIDFLVMLVVIKNNPSSTKIFFSFALISLVILYLVETKLINKKNSKLKIMDLILNIILIMLIVLWDNTGISIALILVLVGQVTIKTSSKTGLGFALASYVSYIILTSTNHEIINFYSISVITINFTLAYVLTLGVKHEITEKEKAKLITKELEIKTKELERAYEKLQELYEEKEEVIILKERNRIAGEIHDTVGHILTTVTIQLEASKRLIKKDPDLALDKLSSAQQQVKNGLQDIRKSVRALKEGENLISFSELLKVFIREMETNSGLKIEYKFTEIPMLNKKVENVIYRAMQEGITNGIRHGGSKAFYIELSYEDSRIKYLIKDNGKGFAEVKLGFGLHNMKSKVEEIGGSFQLQSEINHGVTIYIEIPIVGEAQ